jgi:hypothetical protein
LVKSKFGASKNNENGIAYQRKRHGPEGAEQQSGGTAVHEASQPRQLGDLPADRLLLA